MVEHQFYSTLLDTGASVSFIDPKLADQLKLPITPLTGKVRLAQAGTTADRIGTVDLSFAAVMRVGSKLESQPMAHTFEVMPLDDDQYQFIMGTDLIAKFFPDSIPSAFYLHAPAVTPVASRRATVISTLIEGLDTANVDPTQLMNEMAGYGMTPVEEICERYSVSTSSSVEQEYATKRDEIMNDPSIQDALRTNEQITGFCILPESEVKLIVDPELEHSMYRKQYKVPQAALSAVDECVQRWFDDGRIEYAPPNCPYNSAITVA
jgi:hypothetical protein